MDSVQARVPIINFNPIFSGKIRLSHEFLNTQINGLWSMVFEGKNVWVGAEGAQT
jgi:hypothetical protein